MKKLGNTIEKLIILYFGSRSVFDQKFKNFGYQISEIKRKNKQHNITLIIEHLEELKKDNNYGFHICAVWKFYNEIK